MTLKKQNELLIETLRAVYPVVGRGFIRIDSVMKTGQRAITDALIAVGAMEAPKPE